jgi:tape measure domain-containing protein
MTDFRIRVIIDPDPGNNIPKVKEKLKETENAADRLQKNLFRIFAGLSAGLLIRELGQLADAYTTVRNRLGTVVEGQEELAKVTSEIFAIANRTRQAFDATAEVYARVGLAAKDLGKTQEELLQFTESLNQAVALSGASASEAQAGLIQLSQGLASGALRGDELRSVLEQLPAVADVIAKSLGITRGELRKLGAEGKITADIVLEAFAKARGELNERFAKSVPTIAQSFTVLKNQIVEFIGTLDQATGSSAAVSSSIIFLSNNLEILAAAVTIVGTVILANLVRTAIPALIAQLKLLFDTMAANPFGVLVLGLAALGVAVIAFADKWGDLEREILKATEAGEKFQLTEFGKTGADIQRVKKNLESLNNVLAHDPSNTQAAKMAEEYRTQLEKLGVEQDLIRKGLVRTSADAKAQIKSMEELDRAVAKTVQGIEQQTALLSLNSREREIQKRLLDEVAKLEKESEGKSKVTADERTSIENAIRRNQALADQAAALDNIRGPQQQFEAGLSALNALLEQDKITTDEFNSAVTDLAVNAKGVDLSGIRLPGFDGGDALEKIKATIVAQQEAAKFEAERANVLRDLIGPIQELTDKQVILQNLLSEGEISQEQYTQAMADTEEQIKLLNPEYAAQAALLKELMGPAEDLAKRQAALDALFTQGSISAATYADETNKVTEALNPLTEAQKLQEEVFQSIKGPQQEIIDKTAALGVLLANDRITLQEYTQALADLHAKDQEIGTTFGEGITSGLQKISDQVNDVGAQAEAALVNAFNSASDALADFATTGKLDFADFARSILSDLAKIFAQQLLLGALGGLGIPIPLPGGTTGHAHGGSFEANQSMLVGEKGPELVQFGAPGSVTPAGQTAQALQNNGQNNTTVVSTPPPKVSVNVINVDSPEAAQSAMDTDSGAKVIMNQIRKNRSAIKRELS